MRKIKQWKKVLGPKAVRLGWVKSHVKIKGNEEIDKRAKLGANEEDSKFLVIREGGLKEEWKSMRKKQRCVRGTEEERVVIWKRKARVSYDQCRTSKGNLQSWQNRLDNSNNPSCRFCGNHIETGKHVAFVCPYEERIGQRWEKMDKKKKWLKKVKNREKVYIVDLVETCLHILICTVFVVFCPSVEVCQVEGPEIQGVVVEDTIVSRTSTSSFRQYFLQLVSTGWDGRPVLAWFLRGVTKALKGREQSCRIAFGSIDVQTSKKTIIKPIYQRVVHHRRYVLQPLLVHSWRRNRVQNGRNHIQIIYVHLKDVEIHWHVVGLS